MEGELKRLEIICDLIRDLLKIYDEDREALAEQIGHAVAVALLPDA